MEIQIKEIKIERNKPQQSRVQPGRYRTEKSKIYFFIENETILQNLQERRNRNVKEYRKLMPKVIEAFEKETGYKPEKVSWSQRAGCPCGCSPGFIVDAHSGYTVFVTI